MRVAGEGAGRGRAVHSGRHQHPPAIGQLLCLALSRIRETDADATALELSDDPHALVAALHKLEDYHAGSRLPAPAGPEHLPALCSHPATWERVGLLMQLA